MDSSAFLTYKGRPLVRSGKQIYYGNMYEPYVVMMQVMDEEAQGDLTRSKKVLVKLFNTDPSLNPMEAFEKTGVDGNFYSLRKRSFEEILPWDFIDIGVSKDYLIREAQRSYEAQTTPNCRERCSGCGANRLLGRKCDV